MDEIEGKTERVTLDYPCGERPEPGTVKEIAPGVLWVSMPLPFSLKWINLWLLEDGDGWTMVDTGMGMEETREYWRSIFENDLKGKPITRVVVTHMHPDHVGLAGWVTRKWDCGLWMSRSEYVFCRMLVADTGREAPKEGVEFYAKAGWDEEQLTYYKKRFGGFGRSVSRLPEAFKRLEDNDELVIGGRTWRIITGGGHCPEHVCLYCADLNILISGDQLLPKISSNVSVWPTEPESDPLTDWLDSCSKLIRETPEDVLTLPAHNKPFYGAHKRLQALIDGHERSLDRLAARLEEPKRVVDTFASLFSRKIGLDDMSAATGEALAHLNCLIERGQAKRTLEDGVYLFSKI